MPHGVLRHFILGGGALEAPGDAVTPGVLSALGVSDRRRRERGSLRSNRRHRGPPSFAFAKWVADPNATRSPHAPFVNRVWQHTLRQAIAGNPNNFGVSGKPSRLTPTARLARRRLCRERLDLEAPPPPHHDVGNLHAGQASTPSGRTSPHKDPDNDLASPTSRLAASLPRRCATPCSPLRRA